MKAKKISRTNPPPAPTAPPPHPVSPVPSGATPPRPPTREQVQALAHAIWTDRGCPEGCDVEIWLEAERQLCAQAGVAVPEKKIATPGESVDPDRSEAARIDRELDRIVSPPEQRSPTSL
jgi:hypothetical protein